MRRSIATLATLLACTLTACGSSGAAIDFGTNAPPAVTRPNLSGSYTLRSIDAKPLPATLGDSTITSGLLVMADSTWKQTIVVRYAQGGSGAPGDSLIEAGKWITSGANVTLMSGGEDLYTGPYTSTGFTLSSKTSTLVYTK
jgi:hypothetical protein